jgi:hypothetical protein
LASIYRNEGITQCLKVDVPRAPIAACAIIAHAPIYAQPQATEGLVLTVGGDSTTEMISSSAQPVRLVLLHADSMSLAVLLHRTRLEMGDCSLRNGGFPK